MMTGLIGFWLTIVIYLTAKRLYRYRPIMLFSPILFTPLLLVVLLLCAQIPYADYNEGENGWRTCSSLRLSPLLCHSTSTILY